MRRRRSLRSLRRRFPCDRALLLLVLAVAFSLSTAPGTARFTATSTNGTNSFPGHTLSAPSGLSLSGTCVATTAPTFVAKSESYGSPRIVREPT